MKVHLLSENLQKKLVFLNKGVSTKSQLPVLLNLLIKTVNGKLQISSTDLEIGIQVEIPANIEIEGGITVPAKTFSELVNSLPQGKITLEKEGNVLTVSTLKIKSTFPTISEEEFPKLYEEKGEKLIILKKETLNKDFLSVIFAAASDMGRPALSGVLMKREEGGFSLVATDGYRLSLKEINDKSLKKAEDKEDQEKTLLIPARIFREVISLKDDGEEVNVYVSYKNNQILFEQNETIMVGRLIDAEYPMYEKIIPSSFLTSITFDREEMQKAVKICSIFARETANIIKFTLKKDSIIVSANTPSVGDNKVEVEAKLTGEENEIAFNARYLLDILSNMDSEDIIFEMTGPLNSGVFKIKDDSSFLHLIMPIRVQNTDN
ncbi:DNA polymerase III subunit beta [Candidatus Microgenomates bacterium]|nr:MAG: DNA polymerase III subunit beta [Candidatus Microgenomates bacterium]